MRIKTHFLGAAILSLGAAGCFVNEYSSDPNARVRELLNSPGHPAPSEEGKTSPSNPPAPLASAGKTAEGDDSNDAPSALEHKLDLILARLDGIEKRLEKVETRKQAGKEAKLDQILHKLDAVEDRLGKIEEEAPASPDHAPSSSASPARQMDSLLHQSENLRQIQEEWERFWSTDHPSHLAPERVPGAIQQESERETAQPPAQLPVLPPIRAGSPPTCEDEPDDARVLRALDPVARGVPDVYEEFRDNVEIVKERIRDSIDPPRFFPLIGPAQLHHCHWKCTVRFDETIESSYPFPIRVTTPQVKVVFIDLDHLHLYAGPNTDKQESIRRDLANP